MLSKLEPILAKHPFCSDFDSRELELLAGCASNSVFRSGHVIYGAGDPVDQFYLIRSGKIAVEFPVPAREAITVRTLGEGEILGWSWLLPPYRATLKARAVETTHVIAIDGKCLRKKCESDHDLGFQLFKRVAPALVHQLEATLLQFLDLYRTDN